MLMKKSILSLIFLCLVTFYFYSCGVLDKSPEGAIHLFFKLAKSGEITNIQENLVSSKFMDGFDKGHVTDLVSSYNIKDVETKLVDKSDLKAKVLITIITNTGQRLTCREPVELVYQEGGWKIFYTGLSWPSALRVEGYR